jgi:hypothetical protein
MYGFVLFESSVILSVPPLMVVVPIVQPPILPDVLVSAPALVTLKGEFSPKAIPSDAR